MRRYAKSLVVALGSGILSQPSFAADFPPAVPVAVAAPLYNWSGFYVGGNIGYGWTNAKWDNTENLQGAGFGDSLPGDAFSTRMNGIIGGGQVGYNFQYGGWVYGIEVLVNAANLKGDHASTIGAADDQFSVKLDTLLLATGRVGYSWDRFLVYGKAGFAAARMRASVNDTVPPTTGSGSDRNWQTGPTVGVGLEYGITPALSLAVEYDYAHLNTQSYQLGDSSGSYRWDIKPGNLNLVMAKLNYRFGWAP